MSEPPDKRVIPVKPGAFHIPTSADEEPYLIGSQCSDCGLVYWPPRAVCPNCVRHSTKELRLSRRARIEGVAVVYQAPKGFTAPYVQGSVRMPEGITIGTVFTGVEPIEGCLQIGQEVEMVVDRLREDDNGNTIVGWKFRPVR